MLYLLLHVYLRASCGCFEIFYLFKTLFKYLPVYFGPLPQQSSSAGSKRVLFSYFLCILCVCLIACHFFIYRHKSANNGRIINLRCLQKCLDEMLQFIISNFSKEKEKKDSIKFLIAIWHYLEAKFDYDYFIFIYSAHFNKN